MKKCPRCEKTFPDSETFCEADGTALVPAGPAFAEGAAATGAIAGGEQIECPVCGGKAQPGELICNFCGARLGVESAAATAAEVLATSAWVVRTAVSLEVSVMGTLGFSA